MRRRIFTPDGGEHRDYVRALCWLPEDANLATGRLTLLTAGWDGHLRYQEIATEGGSSRTITGVAPPQSRAKLLLHEAGSTSSSSTDKAAAVAAPRLAVVNNGVSE